MAEATRTRAVEALYLQARPRLASRLGELTLIVMICLSVLSPPITSPGSALWLKIEQVLLPIVISGYAWMLLVGWARLIRLNGMFLIAAVYCLCIAVSMWYGSEFLGQTVIFRDYYEFPKALLPVAFFTLGYEGNLSERSLKTLLKLLGFTIMLVCLYAWAQWVSLGFTNLLNTLYSSGMHDDVLISTRRVYSTLGNANLLGELMTWSIGAFILAALNRIGNRAWYLAIAFGCLVTLAMTGSRYGLINGCLVFVLIFALPSVPGGKRGGQLAFLLLLVGVFAVTFSLVARSNERTLQRFETLRNPLQVDSLRGRLDWLWLDALDEFKQSPIFGRGPAKTIFTGIYTDSEYLDVLKKFGIVGFVPYIAYFLFPLYLLSKGLQAAQRAGPPLEGCLPATLMTLRFTTIMVVMAMVMNIGMSTFYNAPLQGFLFMWLGVGARCAKTICLASARRTGHVRAGVHRFAALAEPYSVS